MTLAPHGKDGKRSRHIMLKGRKQQTHAQRQRDISHVNQLIFIPLEINACDVK
jgi:hypothetical protein